MKNKKTTLLDICNLQAWCQVIVFFKALGFRADSKLTRLGEQCKEMIEYEAGEELKTFRELQKELIDKYSATVLSKRESGEGQNNPGFTEEEADEINKLINADPDKIEISKSLDEIWNREVEFDFERIKVNAPDNCSEKLGEKPVSIEIHGIHYKVHPYPALMDMIRKGYIIED